MEQSRLQDGTQEAVLELFFARSQEALTETERLYGGRLRALCRRILGSAEDAEECVSDALLTAWQRIPPERPVHLFAWLAQVARRQALGRLRSDHAIKRGGGLVEALEELAETELPPSVLDLPGESGRISAVIHAWLKEQPPQRRVAFVRRYFFADSLQETARRTGLSEAAAKSLLYRMRRELANRLNEEGIHL